MQGHILLSILLLWVYTAHCQWSFEEISPRDKQGAWQFQLHESSRQMMDLERAHRKDFRRMREENRIPIHEWSNGEFEVSDVIAQGELFCRYYISFADDPVNTVRGFEVDLKIMDVLVIDVLTGEEYPVIIRGHNFISYYTGDDIKGTRYVTVKVKHTGCIPHPKTCYAETSIATSFGRYSQDNRFPIFATNLATASYEEHCSWMRRIFNFWPLSHFF